MSQPIDIDAIRARHAAAASGPYQLRPNRLADAPDIVMEPGGVRPVAHCYGLNHAADAAFFAGSWQDIADLLHHVEHLEHELLRLVQRLREAQEGNVQLLALREKVLGFLAQQGDDHCWKDWLVDLAGFLGVPFDPALLNRDTMRANCERFCDALYAGVPESYRKAATTAEALCELLNSMMQADPQATHALICNRVPCRQPLVDHPLVLVDRNHVAGGHTVDVLGVLNGLCSATERAVAMKWSDAIDEHGRRAWLGFEVISLAAAEVDEDKEEGEDWEREQQQMIEELQAVEQLQRQAAGRAVARQTASTRVDDPNERHWRLEQARRSLSELLGHYRPHPYVQAIGVGADSIKVMLRREPRSHEIAVPSMWQGYHVETRVVGDITLCSDKDPS